VFNRLWSPESDWKPDILLFRGHKIVQVLMEMKKGMFHGSL